MQKSGARTFIAAAVIAAAGLPLALPIGVALAQPAAGEGEGAGRPRPDFPPFAEVSKDYEKVISTAEDQSLFNVWYRKKDQKLLAELPRGYQNQRHFIAKTVASGELRAGLQSGEHYVYWRRYDKRMALIEPELGTRSTGDQESRIGVNRLFTDRVLLDVPIVAIGPSGQPVIDLSGLLAGQVQKFFGNRAGGANPSLATVKAVKAFPQNIEVTIEMPVAGGRLRSFHYSISLIPDNTGYKPRTADERVGYFTTTFRDLGKFREDEKWVRHINRWHIEKADPRLKMSPPKQPIVFYVEHTVPVRYRRFVRDGVLAWNKAFEKVGITGAIEVYFQDKATGAHMEKDPEDVRFNFIRWLTNDDATAIGPSRTHPLTGQILDADIILTDGWIRAFWTQANEIMPEVAMGALTPETMAWLESNPNWDPRIRLAPPGERDYLLAQRARRGIVRFGGHPAGGEATRFVGEEEFDGLRRPVSQSAGLCMAAHGKGFDMALMGLNLEIMGLLDDDEEPAAEPEKKKDEKKDGETANGEAKAGENGEAKKDDKAAERKRPSRPARAEGDVLDGIPEWFVGPALADLVAHEVGHTLGLRHNFKGSSAYTLAEINSPDFKGKRPMTTTVMDYTPVNINMGDGTVQGDFSVIDIGPYDMWAIEYGYTFEDPKKVLTRVAEPELQFGTDEDTWGPDPFVQQYDFSAEPLEFAESRMRLVRHARERILENFVKDGQSWSRARRGYLITLNEQVRMMGMMSRWVGGAHVYRDKKGDPNGRPPIEVVSAERQREAMQFVINSSFKDEGYGLTPELLKHMTVDKWWDEGGSRFIFEDPTFPIHDRIIGVQASALTMLMNPTTLKRVYDNEFRVAADQDTLTLPELLDSVAKAIWTEVDATPSKSYSPREPMVSSLRRNLQREHLTRLIDLTLPSSAFGAASKPVSNLASMQLRDLRTKIGKILDSRQASERLDAYTRAHLMEAATRIDKALDAQYIYNADQLGGGMGGFLRLFGNEPAPETIQPPRPSEPFDPWAGFEDR